MTMQQPAIRAMVAAGPTRDVSARHALQTIDVSRVARRVILYSPSMVEIERLFALWQAEVGPSASVGALRRVMSTNPHVIQAIALRQSFDWANPSAQGFFAILPLSIQGHLALIDGSFDARDPRPEHLVGQHEKAAAIYFAAIYAPGPVAGGVGLAFEQVCAPLRRDADLYSRLATESGRHLMPQLGFELVDPSADGKPDALYVFRRRSQDPERPPYDTHPSSILKNTVSVVRNLDDYGKVISIRSSVFVAEQRCPYDEEFDGNDFSATHLIGYTDNEPVATIRIRFFADFAKIERVAVRQDRRRSQIAFVIINAARELCRMKGYRTIYGHVQKRYVNFWKRALGARVIQGAREFTFSDFDYIEMVVDIAEHPGAISLGTDPYVMLRPEGLWHQAGILERSSHRPVTRPAADRAAGR